VARIPGSGEDEIWMVVKRVIKGSTVYYLEQMQPRDYGDLQDAWFVDSGISYDSVPTSTISGLDHLEGERVAVWADGAVQTSKIVNGAGQITLDTVASRVIAGLPYRSTIKPMRFDIMTGEGTSKGSIKRFAELVVSFYASGGAKFGRDVDHLFNFPWPSSGLFTGDKVVAHEGGFDVEDPIIITTISPEPLIIRAMIPRMSITGR